MAQYLVNQCGFVHAETAAGMAQLLEAIDARQIPDLVLMDFWLADGISLEGLPALQALCPGVRVLVVSGDEDRMIARKARNAGAHGFVHKQAPSEVFAQAVSVVMGEGTWFAPELDALDISQRRDMPLTSKEIGLTPRQATITGMMLRGYPNRRIADELRISEYTIKEHVSTIFTKLGVSSRMDLIMLMRGRQIEP